MLRPFRTAHNWGNVKAAPFRPERLVVPSDLFEGHTPVSLTIGTSTYRFERMTIPTDVALQMVSPRSKIAKWIRRNERARRIAERQWWPGLHTRWWMEGQER
jgi:hypothetical protein